MSNAAHQSVACLRWMTAAAEDCITSLKHTEERGRYQRRSLAYRELQRTILNADAEPEHALAGLVAAAVGDEANTKLHITGLNALIRNQAGGAEEPRVFEVLSPDVFIMAFTFRPVEVTSFEELNSTMASFRAALRAIAMRAMWLAAERQVLAPLPDSQQYCHALDDLLQDTCIGVLLTVQREPSLPYIRQARHFAMLFALHRNLMVFEDDMNQQVTFLQVLRQMARESSGFDVETNTYMLKPGAVVSIICHLRDQVLQRYVGIAEARRRGTRCSLVAINALKVFGYLSEFSQGVLIDKFRNWLFADPSKHKDSYSAMNVA